MASILQTGALTRARAQLGEGGGSNPDGASVALISGKAILIMRPQSIAEDQTQILRIEIVE
jgi:hypothetical protein